MQALLETAFDSALNIRTVPVGAPDMQGDWPRPTGHLNGLVMRVGVGVAEVNHTPRETSPTHAPPIEVLACPKPDWATVWMDRMASGLRLIRESIQLVVLIWPWFLGVDSTGASPHIESSGSGGSVPDVIASGG
jgi:hypothetical protein